MADSLKTLLGLDSTGGGAWPINAVIDINDDADLRVKNGHTWLKSGVIETNTGLYPDAYDSTEPFLTGNEILSITQEVPFSFNSSSWACSVASFDNSSFWTFGTDSSADGDLWAIEFDFLGNYLSSVNLSSKPTGFTSFADATKTSDSFYLIDRLDDVIKKYDSQWNYVSSINNPMSTTQGFLRGICFSSGYFYVSNETRIEQFDQQFNPTGLFIDAGANESVSAIETDGFYIWILSSDTDTIKSFLVSDGSPTQFSFDVNFAGSSPDGIFLKEDNLWFQDTDDLYELSILPYTGINTAYADSESGIPYYVRVK